MSRPMTSEAPRLNGVSDHDDSELISEKIVVTMTPSQLKSIQDYRFANRINSQSDAVRRLIQLGLEASERKKPNTLI